MSRPLQTNAADPRQIKHAERTLRRDRERFDGALAAVLDTPEGRIVLAGLLERAGVKQSVYDPAGSTMYFKEGKRNFGLEIEAECWRVNERATERMERERRDYLRSLDRTTEAVQQDTEHEEQTIG